MVNTVPLWRQQLAQALTIHRSREAAAAVAAASDLTSDLLRTNAENLRQANAETRRQVERGVFDIAAVSAANQTLIDTIEDSLRIADEGRAARAKAATELDEMEQQLRASLAAGPTRLGTTISRGQLSRLPSRLEPWYHLLPAALFCRAQATVRELVCSACCWRAR